MENERFIRWQNYIINQLTFAMNLFLGFAAASLGYGFSVLLAQTNRLPCTYEIIFIGSLIFLSISLICGSGSVISRLFDFRFTAKKIREEQKGNNKKEVEIYKNKYLVFGKATWRLFWAQSATLGIGLLGLIFSLISIYCTK